MLHVHLRGRSWLGNMCRSSSRRLRRRRSRRHRRSRLLWGGGWRGRRSWSLGRGNRPRGGRAAGMRAADFYILSGTGSRRAKGDADQINNLGWFRRCPCIRQTEERNDKHVNRCHEGERLWSDLMGIHHRSGMVESPRRTPASRMASRTFTSCW